MAGSIWVDTSGARANAATFDDLLLQGAERRGHFHHVALRKESLLPSSLADTVGQRVGARQSEVRKRSRLTATWTEHGIDPAASVVRGGTYVANHTIAADDIEALASRLPSLVEAPDGSWPQLHVGRTLDEGGMGIVRIALQTSLDRQVVVKELREELNQPSDVAQLIREARVTGWLEHPNIVPVYALGRDETGRPLLVMKRIDGRSWWHDLHAQLDEPAARESYLDRNLAVLSQVAKAVTFAHSRGVLHRDIKPENVMLGRSGEVYLVDWGIAASIDKDGPAGVPVIGTLRHIEGTPAYMAPEMVAGIGSNIDERADVYLLGATLHTVLMGQPPHLASSFGEMLSRAYQSEPPSYPQSVPSVLATICRTAMAFDPAERYPSARMFADAIDRYLEHRASTALSDEGARRLTHLRRLAVEGGPEDPRVHTLFSECRFAFRQALRTWSNNLAAKEGLLAAYAVVIDIEISRQNADAAAALVRELDDPPEEMVRLVSEALHRRRNRRERMDELERDVDLSFGKATRERLTLLLAVAWGLTCVAAGLLSRFAEVAVGHMTLTGLNGVFFVATAGLAVATRDTMMANATNRRLTTLVLLVFAGQAALWPVLGATGVSMPHTTMIIALVGAVLWSNAAFAVDKGWYPAPLAKFIAFNVIAVLPLYHLELFGLFAMLGPLGTLVVSRTLLRDQQAR